MERVKDFFFDLSDVVISLVIIAVIFAVVSWKLSDTMPIKFDFFASKPEIVTEVPPLATEVVTIVIPTEAPDSTPEPTESGDAPAVTQAPDVTVAPGPVEVKSITIDIPSGASGDAIAKLLRDKGLVSDIKDFNKVVADLGLGNKLRAGKFTLTTDMTLETMAKRISGIRN